MTKRITPNIILQITKILKLNFFIYFKKNLIVINEKQNDIKIADKLIPEKLILSEIIIFFTPKIETAPKIGIDNKNEIFAASTLLKFNNLAVVIAIPDLLTPGINDNT